LPLDYSGFATMRPMFVRTQLRRVTVSQATL
jgi:hypothetical protein